MSDPRKCQVEFPHGLISGMFIQYGSAVVYDDSDRVFQKTIAIVETDSGRVLEVEPARIRFVK